MCDYGVGVGPDIMTARVCGPVLCYCVSVDPTTEVESKEAVERFAKLSPAEQDAIMARGRRIETLDDLEGLSEPDAERLRPVIEAQTADS